MGKEILVNVANRETRIAVIDDNQLVELRIEREEQVVGNIYKGRVENVLPGMDAAFVDVGLERNAFLYVADILPEYVDSDEDEAVEDGGDEAELVNEVSAQAPPPPSDITAAPDHQSAIIPPAPGAQRSGNSPRNRNRRGGRSRRDETVPAAIAGSGEPPADTASTPDAATEDYSRYLTDPDRASEEAESSHSEAFFDEIGTEDGADFGDIAAAEFAPSDQSGDEKIALSFNGDADDNLEALPERAAAVSLAEFDEDDEIDPDALALARETEEILDEATTRDPSGVTVAAELDRPSAEGLDASISDAAEPSESDALDQDAAMLDAASADRQAESEGAYESQAEASTDARPQPVSVPASLAQAKRGRNVPVGERQSSGGGSAIGQAKRPARRGAPGARSDGRGFSRRNASIADLVHTRQELLLQVVKGPRGTKGSRVSTRMSLPGRYLVLMPDANNLGVSRKIEESKERDRLKNVVERFRQPGYGIIVRTEAEGRSASDLYQDYSMLVETWQTVWAKAKTTPAPSLIHQDQSLIYTIMRDAFGSDIDRLIIDSADDYARACEIIDRISPDLTDRIHLYDGEKPLFEAFRVEQDIDRLLRRKVWLKSGGYLVIDQTEALTSIDVNTGKFVGSSGSGLSETILQTNMEATGEIARQLRLRDLGGMIVLDFIDMDNQRDKKLVMDTLFKALKHDRSRTKIASISPLGLIEMTRKRTKETVDIALTDTCPYCHGIGRVPSAETVSMQVEREIAKIAAEVSSEAIVVTAHPDVIAHLVGEQGQSVDQLERQVCRAIYARADSDYHVEKYEVEPGSASKIEQAFPLPRRGQVIECQVDKSVLSVLPWACAFTPDGYQIEIGNGGRAIGQTAKIRLLGVSRSYAVGEVIGSLGGNGGAASNGGATGRSGHSQGRERQQERGGSQDRGNQPERGRR